MMSETWELRDQDNKVFQLRVFIEATTELWWATKEAARGINHGAYSETILAEK